MPQISRSVETSRLYGREEMEVFKNIILITCSNSVYFIWLSLGMAILDHAGYIICTHSRDGSWVLGKNLLEVESYMEVVVLAFVQWLNLVLFITPQTAAYQAFIFFTIISQNLLKLMSMESVMTSMISSSVIPFSSFLFQHQDLF